MDAFHEALANLNNGEVTHQSFNDVTELADESSDVDGQTKHNGRMVESWRFKKLGEIMNH